MNGIQIFDIATRACSFEINPIIPMQAKLSLPATSKILGKIWERAKEDLPFGDILYGYRQMDERGSFENRIGRLRNCLPIKTTIRCTAGERIDIDLHFKFDALEKEDGDINSMIPTRVLSWNDVWVETSASINSGLFRESFVLSENEAQVYAFEIIKERERIPEIQIEINKPLTESPDPKNLLIKTNETTLIEKGTLNANVICTVRNSQ